MAVQQSQPALQALVLVLPGWSTVRLAVLQTAALQHQQQQMQMPALTLPLVSCQSGELKLHSMRTDRGIKKNPLT